ncbi:hypothetical protein B9Z55_021129 [Caenorhabditis nigoni]|uniref:Lin-15A/B-like domain-containing protein n=1 Tax=Caenorhabditis nigoni TaxID=1611254 RepID=A0A2G5TR81_9PELO|nr:hypothetical protein B9Z55_021129 [Caenorhabditis nigoni]
MEEHKWNQPTTSEYSSNFQKVGISNEKETPVEENNRLIGFKCFECGKVSKLVDFQPIENKKELLVIVIGWALNGLSLPAARAILKEKLPQLMCHEHFEATILKIFEVLEISRSSDIIKRTTYVGTALIHTAQSLCPQLSIYELKSLLFDFCTEHEGGSHSKSAKNRTADFLQKTVPKKFLIQGMVEDKSEQSGVTPNRSRPKILIPRIAKSKAEQSGTNPAALSRYSTPETSKNEQSGQRKVWPADIAQNAIAQFLTDNRDIKIRRVVKRKAEQSWGALTSSEGSSHATSSASDSQKLQNDPKKVVIRRYVRRNAEQSSTSSATSPRNPGIPLSTFSATTSLKPKSSGGSEISCSSFSTSSGPVCTYSERHNSEPSPGTSSEAEQSISEILSQWNVKIEPEEEQKPEKIRPPEEYPSFKILEEIRKSGESDSSELRFDYTEADLKADDFVIKIEPEEELKSERNWDEQWDSEVKEEVNDEQYPATSSETKNELCPSEVGEKINDEQYPMLSMSTGIRDEQSDLPIDTSETVPNLSPEPTKCPICNQPKSIIDLVPLVGKFEKLVVLIPLVIDGFPIEEAISLINSEKFDFVCQEHPISTVTKLFKCLNVSSIEQLQKINIGPKNILTIIAQNISLSFSIGLQRTIFKFCEKFESKESYNQFVMEELANRESPILDEQCLQEVEKEVNDEKCSMSSTSSGIRDEQFPTTSSASEIRNEQSDIPIDTSETVPNLSPESTKCPICNQPKSIIDLVPLVEKYEKLVVLIPWVMNGFSIQEAISLLNSEEFDFVCLEHPISTVSKLFESLNVSSIEGLQKINIGPSHNLTKIARSISSIFSIGLQRTIFKFCEKFESQESYNQFVMEELERRENEGFVGQMKCVVCRKEEAKDLRKLGDSEEKLILLSAFLDKITVGIARSIYKSNGVFRACHSHFEHILKHIFEILRVSRIADIKKCSIGESDPWMNDVRKLRSDTTSNQYFDLLHGFCVRNGAANIIETTPENIQMANSEKCVICEKVKSRPFLRKMDHFIEKIIVFTGWILTDKKAEIQAIPLLKEQNLFVCWSHFPEFSGRIFNELCIKNLNQLSNCYRFLVEKLMRTINVLVPNMKQGEFLDEFRKWLMASDWCKPQAYVQSNDVLKNKKKHFTCALCHKKIEERLGRVESREDKLILMIASILDRRFDLDVAASFVRSQKEFIVCFEHFQSAIKRILLFLSIQHMNQLATCRQDLMQNLMVVVRNLNEEVRITTDGFRQIMSDFYENHCTSTMNPPPKRPTRPHIMK